MINVYNTVNGVAGEVRAIELMSGIKPQNRDLKFRTLEELIDSIDITEADIKTVQNKFLDEGCIFAGGMSTALVHITNLNPLKEIEMKVSDGEIITPYTIMESGAVIADVDHVVVERVDGCDELELAVDDARYCIMANYAVMLRTLTNKLMWIMKNYEMNHGDYDGVVNKAYNESVDLLKRIEDTTTEAEVYFEIFSSFMKL